MICKFYGLDEDDCNKYEFNPLTKMLTVDQQNSGIDDRVQVEKWCLGLDWKKIIEPLIVKPIINPFELEPQEGTEQDIEDLKNWDSVWASVWASVGASVGDSVWASVWNSVGDSVWASVRASVGDSVWASVWASVRASVGAYIGSFFDTEYNRDFLPAIRLWDRGFVTSFDGETWRLHAGKNAKIVYEMKGNVKCITQSY
jgi:hypothetical protein